MKASVTSTYLNAKKRVGRIKGFYEHLAIFFIGNLVYIGLALYLYSVLMDNGIADPEFLKWFKWNVVVSPIIWTVILMAHGVYAHKYRPEKYLSGKPGWLYRWEQRQILRFMKKLEGARENLENG